MTINCETAPIILPPVAKNPNNKGGIVHGTSKTTRGQNPIVVKNQPIVNPTAGTIKNGIPKIGFNTIGKPKVIVSLILNNPGTSDNEAIALLSSRLANIPMAIKRPKVTPEQMCIRDRHT